MHPSKNVILYTSALYIFFRCLGNSQSFASWEQNRLAAGFELSQEAKRKSEEKQKLIASGTHYTEDYVGNVRNRE